MLDLSSFSNFGFSLNTIVQLGFYFVLGIYAVFTAIFYYHWQTYGTNAKVTGITLLLYFLTTIPLLIAMGVIVLII